MIAKILSIDSYLSKKISLREDQTLLRGLSSIIAHSGDSWYIELLLFFIWIFSRGLTHTLSAYFAGSVVIQAAIVIALKFMIKRQRPEGTWGDVYRKTDPHSFPSGHAARVMMLAVLAFGFALPILGWILLVWGFAVSIARVALGVHFLVDIMVGWLIGVLLGLMMLGLRPFFFDLFPAIF